VLQSGWTQSFPEPQPGDISSHEVPLDAGQDEIGKDFGNYKNGLIVVRKVVDSENPAPYPGFSFEGAVTGTVTITEGIEGQLDPRSVKPGQYSVTELPPPEGFSLASIVCVDEDGTVFQSVDSSTATFDLRSRKTVTCTFTNEDEDITAIGLISFEVEANDGRARILWETGTEIDNAGFNIYRAGSPDGPWVKVNDSLIGAEGEVAAGASYTFYDTPGRGLFYYRLEDVDLFGLTTQHEPVMARIGPAVRLPWFRPSVPEF
jgi:hypothetical protein